jgi:hypothetical protein
MEKVTWGEFFQVFVLSCCNILGLAGLISGRPQLDILEVPLIPPTRKCWAQAEVAEECRGKT